MTGDTAIIHTALGRKKVRIEYVNEYGTASVRATHGAPFTIRGSKVPYHTCQTDQTVCDVRELDFEEPVPDYGDPAAEDAEAERRQTQEWLDERDFDEQNGHAPGFRGG